MNKMNSLLVKAAMAGMMGAVAAPQAALANHHEKGQCQGANACKGKGACHTATNACAGQNACKGQSFIETTKAECEKLAKKDPKIKFEMPKKDSHG